MSKATISKSIEIELVQHANKERARLCERFFKTKPGEYGAGDRFLGIPVPIIRSIVKTHQTSATIEDAERLLDSRWHECRFAGVILLIHFYKTGTDADRDLVYRCYLASSGLNNWDLIDISAYAIVGTHLLHKSIAPLKQLARSESLWKRRIAICATGAMILERQFKPTMEITEMLMKDRHDLIHKACGWMLREVGKGDPKQLEAFLKKHLPVMPRTMLRYAIEKMPETKRKEYLKKIIAST